MNEHDPKRDETLDPELEARVVAWIAGEASAFEAAELERLCAERPEVGAFKQRIEAVQALTLVATKAEASPLRLSAERRAKVLAVIAPEKPSGAEATNTIPLAQRLSTFPRLPSPWSWQAPRIYFALAGVAAASLVVFLSLEFQKKPLYLATAKLQFEKPDAVVLTPGISDQTLRSDVDLNTNVQVLGSNRLRGMVAESLQRDAKDAEARIAAAKASGGEISASDQAAVRWFGGGGQPPQTQPSPVASAAPKNRAKAETDSRGEVVVLSPFEVSAPREDKGFKAKAPAVGPRAASALNEETAQLAQRRSEPQEIARRRAYVAKQDANAADARLAGKDLTVPGLVASGGTVTAGITAPQTGQMKFGGAGISGALNKVQSGAGLSATDAVSPNAPSIALQTTPTFDAKKIVTLTETSALNLGQVTATAGLVLSTMNDHDASALAREGAKNDAPLARQQPAADDTLRAEIATARESVSTFSLHVSDVSFRLAAAALARGTLPDAASVRPEEFYNALDYGDPAPAVAERIGARIEQAAHPFLQQRNLVRIAMKVATTGRGAQMPLRLTVLLDTSGSMEREDRAAAVRRALEVLASLLSPMDRLTVIGFARQPRLLAENISGDRVRAVLDTIARTPAEGGTNLEEALKLASEHARRNRIAGAQNRIVVLTDGAANLGNANPDQLATMVESLRQSGIAFDACGVGLDGLDDTVLEALTRKGDGRYYVLNSPDAADAGFARQLAGAFRPAAENVKVQVRFNPARVASYRLIGFEQHRLREQDFRNDQVDAAELAAEEAGVALYQVEPLPQGEGDLGEVFVRFRDPATGAMVERSWMIPYDARATTFARATPSLQLAGVAALLAEKLRGGPVAAPISLHALAPIVSTLESHYRGAARVPDLVTMFNQLRRLTREP